MTERRSRGCASRAKWNKQARAGRCLALHPAVTRRTRACPAIAGPGTLWVQIAALLPTARLTTHSAASAPSPTGSSSTSSSKCWCSAAAAQDGRHQLLGDHPRAAAATNGSAPGGRAAAPCGAGRLRPAVRPGDGAPGGGRLHHQGALRRAGHGPSPVDRRKRGLKRSMVTEAGGVPLATLPAQPSTRRRAAGGDAGHQRRDRRATRTASGASGRRLRLEALPTGSWPKAGWSARSPH
jgi:hypothetical protein